MQKRWLVAATAGVALGLGACSSDSPASPPGVSAGAGGAAAGSGGSGTSGAASGGANMGGGGGAGGASGAGGMGGASGVGTAGALSTAGAGGSAAGSGGNGGGGAAGAAGTGGNHWVGTWSAAQYAVAEADQPPTGLLDAVLRQVTRVSLGGERIRVQFSNLAGTGALTIKTAHVALCKAAPAVDSSIDVTTDTALTFNGMQSVDVPPGQEVWSDPVDFALPPLANVSITTTFLAVPGSLTGHAGSRTTSYVQAASSEVSAPNMASALKTDHWYFIAGIDVMAGPAARAVVAIGDSITDGRGTDTNRNNRWTDVLAARLQSNEATKDVAVMNQGIGASTLVGSGTAGEARFQRDVLGRSGVKYAIVLYGVNDIGTDATFATMKSVYDQMIAAAHGAGVRIFGGTILPFGGNAYYTEAHEGVRDEVNAYVKSGAFDGFIDFDAAVTDNGNPPKLQTAYATWAQTDWLHPSPAGYQQMGSTPALTLFAP